MNEKYGIGQSVSRFEDPRLLRGEGRFINDIVVPGMAHIAYVRSPHARARIVVDRRRPRRSPRPACSACSPSTTWSATASAPPRRRSSAAARTASRCSGARIPGLAKGIVRHVGDPVAIVAAETQAQAKDAAELRRGGLRGAARQRPGVGRMPGQRQQRVRGRQPRGDRGARSPRAAHVVKRRYTVSRVHAQFMEPRGALGEWDRGDGPLHAALRRAVPAPRARDPRRRAEGPASTAGPRRQPRRRRRVRRQGLGAPRAPARAVARAQARPAGEMDLRPQRGAARRRARARPSLPRSSSPSTRSTASSRCARTTPARSAPTFPPTATCCPASPTSARSPACT